MPAEGSVFEKRLPRAQVARLEAEREGLAALRDANAVRVPAVFDLRVDARHACLRLERLALEPLSGPTAARLGEALATLHRPQHTAFGWEKDNWIGGSVQANARSDDWLGFWRTCRLQPQLHLAACNHLPSRLIEQGERLLADCDVVLRGHNATKSLLHGDLWGGNAGALPDGMPVVFDPAVYIGDREADLAMTELFGGFPADFLAAYRNAWPLDEAYPLRRDFYNLYHVLNHANLFAGGYVRQSEHAIERLLAQIR